MAMQPLLSLQQWLQNNANHRHYLFSAKDLRALFPTLSQGGYKALLSRAVKSQLLQRVCRGIYLYQAADPKDGLLLFHTAALLRANAFNYISLETTLSDAGVISQIPHNKISLMSSGRSHTVDCGHYGSIEFVHTKKPSQQFMKKLHYDTDRGLWRADVSLAISDMKKTMRNLDLINWEVANELIRSAGQ